jgi:hypothetical protein
MSSEFEDCCKKYLAFKVAENIKLLVNVDRSGAF